MTEPGFIDDVVPDPVLVIGLDEPVQEGLQLLERHNGDISIESRPGDTVLRVGLPLGMSTTS